jgi:hypothetical protein
MFPGEMGRLQPPTSYAVARTIGSRGCGGGWNAAHEAEGKPFSLTFRICVAKEAAQKREWTPPAVEKAK